MTSHLPVQVWLLVLIALAAIPAGTYVYRYWKYSPSRLDVTEPRADYGWRSPATLWLCLLGLLLLAALAYFIFTPAASRFAHSPSFWPILMIGLAGFAAYQVAQGFRTGSEEPMIRGFTTSYSRATQPMRFWASMLWNSAVACLMGFGAFTGLAPGSAQTADRDTSRCFDQVQRYSAEDALSSCNNLIDEKAYSGKDLASLFAFRASAYQRLGDDGRAINDLTEAIRLNPDFEEFGMRGLSHMKKHEYATAIDDFSESIRLNPQFAHSYSERAFARHLTGDDQGAIDDLGAAIRLKPDDWQTHYSRGTIYMRRGDNSLAIADLSDAIRLRPAFPEAYYNRSIAYVRAGDEERGEADRSAAIRLRPDLAKLDWPPPPQEAQ